ncbi:MAG: aldehyde ferredoxin oxidoreductase family protein [Spirochaeta sp.]|jgi:aldehyde:ferredoxin oxidoreductase|nr:aldehyde ferredoxin oxidoreductase family protein [Spirochaeta sp.]
MSYMGKLIRVNLTSGKISYEDTPMDLARKYIGGRGLGSRIFINEVDPKVDAFSPENKLIFMTGPLSNTTAPTGGRYMVITKSPLTGTIASSNSGGVWGAYLKKAGYDGLIFEGDSAKPVYLIVSEIVVELKDASHVWGKRVEDTTNILSAESGEKRVSVSCIGPAGENKVLYASIMNEVHRAAGRSGVGAVMGSKNLKAVITWGAKESPIKASKDDFREITKDKIKKLKEGAITGQGLPSLGTKVLDNIINENGMYPTRNAQEVMFEGVQNMSGEALIEKGYLKRNTGCYMCPIQCARDVEMPNGRRGEGPEYETGWAFGPMMGIDDLNAICDANFTCNDLGMDTISAGVTMACMMEMWEKGLIPKEDLANGPEPNFGSTEALAFYLGRTAHREGIGAKLADGSFRFADSYGHPEYSMTVKKQEIAAYDPRGVQGHGLQYAVGNRGADHVRAYLISPEILGAPEKLDPQEVEGKPMWAKIFQDLTGVIDSSGLCLFTSFSLGAEDYNDLISAATGFDMTVDEMMQVGERIWNMERKFNQDSGIDPKEDTLPKRFFDEPITVGPNKGKVHRLPEMLPKYYEVRGWSADGRPTKEKLAELSLT